MTPVADGIPDPVPWSAPLTDPSALAAVAMDTLRYLRDARGVDPLVPGPGDIQATLERIVVAGGRIADPAWLGRCFTSHRWVPDSQRWQGDIRLTRYLVYEVDGALARDAAHGHALYAVPDDESGLSAADAVARRDALDRFRYTRQDVSGGVYRAGGAAEGRARPLVWLSLDDHEQALLQGTTSAALPDGRHLYNVDRDNGLPYDRAQADTTKQRRLWYFRETDRVRGWGVAPVPKIALEANVSVAGDLANVGLGTVLALKSADGFRIVVLADTGGAFQPNLHQLDLYTGIYPSKAAFLSATRAMGDTASAWILTRTPGARACE